MQPAQDIHVIPDDHDSAEPTHTFRNRHEGRVLGNDLARHDVLQNLAAFTSNIGAAVVKEEAMAVKKRLVQLNQEAESAATSDNASNGMVRKRLEQVANASIFPSQVHEHYTRKSTSSAEAKEDVESKAIKENEAADDPDYASERLAILDQASRVKCLAEKLKYIEQLYRDFINEAETLKRIRLDGPTQEQSKRRRIGV